MLHTSPDRTAGAAIDHAGAGKISQKKSIIYSATGFRNPVRTISRFAPQRHPVKITFDLSLECAAAGFSSGGDAARSFTGSPLTTAGGLQRLNTTPDLRKRFRPTDDTGGKRTRLQRFQRGFSQVRQVYVCVLRVGFTSTKGLKDGHFAT